MYSLYGFLSNNPYFSLKLILDVHKWSVSKTFSCQHCHISLSLVQSWFEFSAEVDVLADFQLLRLKNPKPTWSQVFSTNKTSNVGSRSWSTHGLCHPQTPLAYLVLNVAPHKLRPTLQHELRLEREPWAAVHRKVVRWLSLASAVPHGRACRSLCSRICLWDANTSSQCVVFLTTPHFCIFMFSSAFWSYGRQVPKV